MKYCTVLLRIDQRLCMSKVSKETHNTLQVLGFKGLERDSKYTIMFLMITFFIFNPFSIRKKFWKAET